MQSKPLEKTVVFGMVISKRKQGCQKHIIEWIASGPDPAGLSQGIKDKVLSLDSGRVAERMA